MPIRVLPISLVNKIAAGEVIERPASVVKELVENALDAGALAIEVAVEDGGRRLIRVTDDGAGMGKDDLALAFAPHATSKIATEKDLFDIRTMGFRGEALASIAAVSRAHVRSRGRAAESGDSPPPQSGGVQSPSSASSSSSSSSSPPRLPSPLSPLPSSFSASPLPASPRLSSPLDAAGYEVEAVGGEITPVRPCPAAEGTTITVRDLFYNVPARRKFLRVAATELGHVAEQVTRVALANPRVAFTLLHNGRVVQRLPAAAGTLERARDLFGEELAAGLLPIVRRGGAVGVAGLIGSPASARASAKWQYFFLNGRYIRDRVLAHALREAYRGACDPSRWPVAIIFLEIDPAEVDVNVHPTKIEVRFRESDRVHGELLASLRETLNRSSARSASLAGAQAEPAAAGLAQGESAAEGTPAREGGPGAPDQDAGGADDVRRQGLRQAMADFFRTAAPHQPRFSFPDAPASRAPRETEREPVGEPLAALQTTAATDALPVAVIPRPLPDADGVGQEDAGGYVPVFTGHVAAKPQAASGAVAPQAAIQVHDSYILASCPEGVLIIDQHALHERVLYNELKRRLAGGTGALEAQRLLLPATLRVSPAEIGAAAGHEALLHRLGIEVTPFGPDSLAVQEFPSLLVARGVRPEEFLRELLDTLAESPHTGPEAILEEVLAMMACKAAVKAGQPLAAPEIESLLAQAELAERSFACPHGRPAVLKLTLRDLEKQFQRT